MNQVFKWSPVVTLVKAGNFGLSFLVRKHDLVILLPLGCDLRLRCHAKDLPHTQPTLASFVVSLP